MRNARLLIAPLSALAIACGGTTDDVDTGTGTGTGTGTDSGTGTGTGTGTGGSNNPVRFELTGDYTDNFGGTHAITQTEWTTDFGSGSVVKTTIAAFDNVANEVYLQSSADDAYSPNKFSKNVWTEAVNGTFYYCTVEFGLDTLELAKASTKTADGTSPETGGCGTFPWTKMTAYVPFELKGSWNDNYGSSATITQTQWGDSALVAFDNDKNEAYVQAPADASWNPSKFSKYVWTEISNGSFYYCTLDYGLDTLELAKASTKVADPTSPETGGCGAFPWTKMTLKQ